MPAARSPIGGRPACLVDFFFILRHRSWVREYSQARILELREMLAQAGGLLHVDG
jgi:hypothetical protein